jgi:hypothetical protein
MMDDQRGRSGVGFSILAVVGAVGAVVTFGLLSGIPVVFAHLGLRRERRSGTRFGRVFAWGAVVFAWAALLLGWWFWRWFLWDQHYHPGAGGPVPPPTLTDLLYMPMACAVVTLVVLALIWLIGRASKRASTRNDGPSSA